MALERESRFARPVALACWVAVVAFVVSGIVASSALSDVDSNSTADLLAIVNDDPINSNWLPSFLRALTFILIGVPLAYLFRAAASRESQVREPFFWLIPVGCALTAISLLLSAVALDSAASEFVDESPQPAAESGAEVDRPAEDEDAREERADDTREDQGTFVFAQAFGLPGFLALGLGLLYTGLWAMRTGLLTRFMGTLAMALGVLIVLPPFSGLGVFMTMLWLLYVGTMIGGWLPGGRPPAWEAGRSIPWPKPGDAGGDSDDAAKAEPGETDAVEGSGREISEPPLPEEGSEKDEQSGETQGQRRKKRKRRN